MPRSSSVWACAAKAPQPVPKERPRRKVRAFRVGVGCPDRKWLKKNEWLTAILDVSVQGHRITLKTLDTKASRRKGSATEKTPVKGGWISRDGKTGRFVEVGSEHGRFRSSDKSEAAVKAASLKRS